MQFEMSMKQINDWTSGAEEMLDSGYDGLDYDTLTDTLSEHRVSDIKHWRLLEINLDV